MNLKKWVFRGAANVNRTEKVLLKQCCQLPKHRGGHGGLLDKAFNRRLWLDSRVRCKGYFNFQNRPNKLKRPLSINYETKLTQPYHRTELCLKNPRPKAWNCSILVCYELFLGNFIYFELWISFRTFFRKNIFLSNFFHGPTFLTISSTANIFLMNSFLQQEKKLHQASSQKQENRFFAFLVNISNFCRLSDIRWK